MSLLTKREYYKPFEYQQAYEYWLLQQGSFWIHTEVNLDSDLYDWKFNLTESERRIIGNILKSFVQSEILIGDYWRKIANTFKKPEITMMASAFSSFETIHQAAYAYLNDSLGLDDFKEFLRDKVVMERLEQLSKFPTKSKSYKRDLARSIAVFSAFGEGVLLFSAFTILLSFSQRGLMRGLGEIIEMSIRDETLHAKAGCWLYNTFMEEYKDKLCGQSVDKYVYDACELSVLIEDQFIESVFESNSLENCDPKDLKQFMRSRANDQLKAIKLEPRYLVSEEAVKRLNWFNLASAGDQHSDFFASRVTQYARTSDWDKLWEGV